MGFLEYARTISSEKDHLKVRYIVKSDTEHPQIINGSRLTIIIPEPKIYEDTISFLGYNYPFESWGKQQIVKIFRASVSHLGGHAVASKFEDYDVWKKGRNQGLANFVRTVVEDIVVNAYILAKQPDKTIDLSYANALALRRMENISDKITPASRIMLDILTYANTGLKKFEYKKDGKIVDKLIEKMDDLREAVPPSSLEDNSNFFEKKLELADRIYSTIMYNGPVVEIPYLPHTEGSEPCTLLPPLEIRDDGATDRYFTECLRAWGNSDIESPQHMWKPALEAEFLQVFDSWFLQKEKEEKILSKYRESILRTRFKSVKFSDQDYSEYLTIKALSRSETRRLISSLLVARDALDEDPGKPYGVLDLQDVIQVLASKTPRSDIFMLDEYIDKSYSWIILIDVSKSMQCSRMFVTEIATILADAANELLMDTTAWSMYAFNDRFFIIKDANESYNSSVKSRIGGMKFEGMTYLPDALQMASRVLRGKVENMKLITIVSDGVPCGYQNISEALSESIANLEKNEVVIIGIGVNTERMNVSFKSSFSVSTLKDVTKNFTEMYMDASKEVA